MDCVYNCSGPINTSQTAEPIPFIADMTLRRLERILYSRVIVVICVIGLVGNAFNLLVLTSKSFHFSMGRMEKFAFAGLVALAVSDMMFCLVVLPYVVFDPHEITYTSRSFCLVYLTYSDGVINAFIMTSTWLTVMMAVGRYLAICHPLRARALIGLTFAKRAIALVYLLAVLANLPRFFAGYIDVIHIGGQSVYYRRAGALTSRPQLDAVYMWVYFQLSTCIPLVLMAYCNMCLIRALGISASTRSRFNADSEPNTRREHHRITLTLVIIVLVYIILVTPASIINFVNGRSDRPTTTDRYNLGVAVVNTLQACNFAFNFALYCTINAYFRGAALDLLRCFWLSQFVNRRQSPESATLGSTAGYTMHSGRYCFVNGAERAGAIKNADFNHSSRLITTAV